MATMRQIRTRIRVAGNTAQITGAMEMVAAARLKRAQDRVTAARPYVTGMAGLVADLMRCVPPEQRDPLLQERPVNTVGVMAITADRGLCGSYNSGVFRRADQLLASLDGKSVRLMVIGRKGRAYFSRRGFDAGPLPVVEAGQLGFSEAVSVSDALQSAYLSGAVDQVQVVYTRFISPLTQDPVVEQLLPIAPPVKGAADQQGSEDVLTEPSASALTAQLLPLYLVTRVYHAMLESTASEHGARMTSMSSATDNATKMISTLTLELNRARQAAITKEISEIVSGAEALSS